MTDETRPDPEHPGEILLAQGRAAEAALAFADAADAEPWHFGWRERQVAALIAAGDIDGALSVTDAEVARRPGRAAARCLRGLALGAAGRASEAVHEWREAWSLDPAAETALGLAAALEAAGEPADAAEVLQAAARRFPEDPAIPTAEGRAWAALGEYGKARAAFHRALARDADAAGARDGLAHLDQAGDELPPAFVRALFDRYADRFDAELTGTLRYRAPEQLRAAVAPFVGAGGLDVLDLGCGTGLAGLAFRPFARFMAGVDLSPRMLGKAADRRIYDELAEAEAVQALAARPGHWDLVVAADVLVYVGDLVPCFTAAATALRPGGLFAFTVERGEEAPVLGPGRRFRHGETYVRRSAAEAGLAVELLRPCVPRHDRGQPVEGLLCVLRRPVSSSAPVE
ncbi:MAG TPA: methyltransferase [Azospirillaceae bacterium]|nr:methyltransferase [Azospirillaceae bacterium]